MPRRVEIAEMLALELLEWNRRHLTASTELSESVIAQRFAANFVVRANGRRYEANHNNYKAFLDGFKRSIASIEYDVQELMADTESAFVAMDAKITRSDQSVEQFAGILLLRFDESGLVKLWHEVYVRSA